METELSRNIDIAKEKAQYDFLCKKILANKTVLAWIMRRTVKEYAGMSIEEIKACIEGEPEIAVRGVNPGESNPEDMQYATPEQGKGLRLMCNLSDVIEERGIEKGRIDTLVKLVRDGILNIRAAAEQFGLSELEFAQLIKKA